MEPVSEQDARRLSSRLRARPVMVPWCPWYVAVVFDD